VIDAPKQIISPDNLAVSPYACVTPPTEGVEQNRIARQQLQARKHFEQLFEILHQTARFVGLIAVNFPAGKMKF